MGKSCCAAEPAHVPSHPSDPHRTTIQPGHNLPRQHRWQVLSQGPMQSRPRARRAVVTPPALLAEQTAIGGAAWASPSLSSNATRKATVGARGVHGNSEADQAEAAAEGPRPKQAKYVRTYLRRKGCGGSWLWLWWVMVGFVVQLRGHHDLVLLRCRRASAKRWLCWRVATWEPALRAFVPMRGRSSWRGGAV